MRGQIKKRGSSYSVIVYLGRGDDGKKKYKWKTCKTKGEAEKELSRMLHELHTGAFVEPSEMTVTDYLRRWLSDYAKPNVSGKTFERYQQIVEKNLIPGLGKHKLEKLKPLHIQGYYSKMLKDGRDRPITRTLDDGTVEIVKAGLSAQTVLHFHRLLRQALAQAVKWQILARNPADAVEPPRPEWVEMKTLDKTEVDKLLFACRGTLFYMPVMIAVTTGMRRGEILALRWSDIDMDNGIISVRRSLEDTKDGLNFKEPKTAKSRRTVTMPVTLNKAIIKHKGEQAQVKMLHADVYQDNGLVCCKGDGSPIEPDYLSDCFRRYVEKAGIKHVRFHDLRHTHATLLLQEGVHAKIVSERLGHSDIGMTLNKYSHVLPSMQEEAARKIDDALRRKKADF